jgi:hypothetical protein
MSSLSERANLLRRQEKEHQDAWDCYGTMDRVATIGY